MQHLASSVTRRLHSRNTGPGTFPGSAQGTYTREASLTSFNAMEAWTMGSSTWLQATAMDSARLSPATRSAHQSTRAPSLAPESSSSSTSSSQRLLLG